MPKIADRILETTMTTGTGAITLGGAMAGYRTFSDAFVNGDTLYYTISGSSGWEVGIGTYNTGNTLSRTTILKSSNSNSAVNFGTEQKSVFVTAPEEYFNEILGAGMAMSIALG